ncbi:hypothetical protein [Algibacillus agarilyticus]|uniref:hypothetical protein n=1 Tax=Algibacillus agarilyticus TaxID=2234133 RepID=UPI000DCFABB5|nr:hypothetical protein [Algibacillus agarilyticus]
MQFHLDNTVVLLYTSYSIPPKNVLEAQIEAKKAKFYRFSNESIISDENEVGTYEVISDNMVVITGSLVECPLEI